MTSAYISELFSALCPVKIHIVKNSKKKELNVLNAKAGEIHTMFLNHSRTSENY